MLFKAFDLIARELTIIDPSLSGIAHAIGSGAKKLAGGIARVKAIPRYARAAAREAGRIVALPQRLGQEYELGRE